jgi:hypothetical protein
MFFFFFFFNPFCPPTWMRSTSWFLAGPDVGPSRNFCFVPEHPPYMGFSMRRQSESCAEKAITNGSRSYPRASSVRWKRQEFASERYKTQAFLYARLWIFDQPRLPRYINRPISPILFFFSGGN